jgi:hypothetical protein
MRFFIYRPSGHELQPQPASILEVLIVFTTISLAGTLAGVYAYHKYDAAPKPCSLIISGVVLGILLIWLFLRAIMVREGLAHPIGTLEDRNNHTCCSTRS